MDASLTKASALRLRFSQSLANRRQRLMNLMGASWGGGDICGHEAYFGGCQYVSLYSIGGEAGLVGTIRCRRLSLEN
jgi:hypothetical protein